MWAAWLLAVSSTRVLGFETLLLFLVGFSPGYNKNKNKQNQSSDVRTRALLYGNVLTVPTYVWGEKSERNDEGTALGSLEEWLLLVTGDYLQFGGFARAQHSVCSVYLLDGRMLETKCYESFTWLWKEHSSSSSWPHRTHRKCKAGISPRKGTFLAYILFSFSSVS